MSVSLGQKTYIISGLLILGAGSSVTMKIMLNLHAPGYNQEVHNYDKPFMQSILMFFAMSFALVINRFWDVEKNGEKRFSSTFREKVIVAIPASFDLIASTIMTFGLIFINVSIFQMLRGSMVVFSVIFSFIFFHTIPQSHQWLGIFGTIFALVMIAIAGVYIPSPDTQTSYPVGKKILGSFLVIISQMIQAGQIVVEQYILKDIHLSSLSVVGWEGINGLLMMIFFACPFALICPGDQPSPLGPCLENIGDSLQQMFRSGYIVLTSCLFMLFVLGLNIFGMLVTAFSSATFRTIMEAVRTLMVWIVMLMSYAAGAPFGEQWTNWSFLELFGFIVLVLSALIYNGILKLPCFEYENSYLPHSNYSEIN